MTSTYSTPHGASPFVIRPEVVDIINDSRGFQILRSYLAGTQDHILCEEHFECSEETYEEWILHRDIIHAVVMPVVQLFNRAADLAQAALCSTTPDDWELAFRDDARDAFLSLQCFLEDEGDWCHSEGCPACVVSTTLSSDTHIRFVIAAVLLSESMPVSSESVTLPQLSFFLGVMRSAMLDDPLWGASFSEHLYSRAEQFSTGMRAMIEQCKELEALVLSPANSPVRTSHKMDFSNVLQKDDGTIKVSPSELAKRQAKLRQEEEAYLQMLAHQCWGHVALPRKLRLMMKPNAISHKRSLTCPV
ncbi:hypothetical protein EJ05DRAFT_213288 [Pseudovirgaria hyperparasitica]|uniref:Uncharacterized protein n=1 Tax=Pseudovirgaria hyperparasitica TaxID=470096 RepID=A0A6A6VTA8_9PEZI|nr:uncharacterized protein EJ05DRAFT_213288 [Pseudovirgaria hyperparasitica]KAF2753385.1 hypothetical protein EJ05DRAFT_213288 [Pseudovirgaria hyperparasitica]